MTQNFFLIKCVEHFSEKLIKIREKTYRKLLLHLLKFFVTPIVTIFSGWKFYNLL